MSNLGGKKMSEDTDRNSQVTSVVAGARITVDNTDPTAPVIIADVQAGGQVDSVVAGDRVTIDNTDPVNPVITADVQAGGQVDSVVGGTNCTVDAADPVNPIVNVADEVGIVETVVAGTNITSIDNTDPANPIINAATQAGDPSPLTTKGDIYTFDTDDQRLSIGTDDQVLTADAAEATGMKWATPAAGGGGTSSPAQAAHVRRDTTLTLSGWTVIPWQTEDYDDNGFVDIGTNDDRLTVPTGVTRVNLSFQFSTTNTVSASDYAIKITHFNSSDVEQEVVTEKQDDDTISGIVKDGVSALGVPCVAGDYFKCNIFFSDVTVDIDYAKAAIQDATVGSQATVAFHGARVEKSGSTARTASTFIPVYDTEVYDTDAFADLGTSNDRITIPAGVTKVRVTAMIAMSSGTANTDNFFFIEHYNGADVLQRQYGQDPRNTSGIRPKVSITPIVVVAQDDYFKLSIHHNDASWSETYISLDVEYKDGTLTESATTILTTKGDTLGYSTVPARLAVGTDTHVLTADSTEPTGVKWVAPAGGSVSGCELTVVTDITGLGTSQGIIDWENEIYDDDSFADLGTNSDRVTVPTGVTRINLSCKFRATSFTAGLKLSVIVNHRNSGGSFLNTIIDNSTTDSATIHGMVMGLTVAAGDYFEINYLSGDSSWAIAEARCNMQAVG